MIAIAEATATDSFPFREHVRPVNSARPEPAFSVSRPEWYQSAARESRINSFSHPALAVP